MLGAGAYIRPHTVRRRLGAMARPRSSSLIFGDQPPMEVGGLVLRRLPGRSGEGTSAVPGCLTSESEERETWTAESLRTAASDGAIRTGHGRWKRLRRYTFLGQHCDHASDQSGTSSMWRRASVVTRAKRCDQPVQVLTPT